MVNEQLFGRTQGNPDVPALIGVAGRIDGQKVKEGGK